MLQGISRGIAWILVAVHAGLGAWALVGFAELALAEVPWRRLSNPLFSRPMLLLQWSLVALAATVFIAGYLRRWKRTPHAMCAIYAAMAAVCAYQTFFILTHASRFRAMGIEYLEYTVILIFLYFSAHMRERFSRSS